MNRRAERVYVRELLAKWGNWKVMYDRLRREKTVAQQLVQRDDDSCAHDLLRDIKSEMDQLIKQRAAISALVARLPAEEQQVLIYRYEYELNAVQIGLRLFYDERTVRRFEACAVDRIAGWLADKSENQTSAGSKPVRR